MEKVDNKNPAKNNGWTPLHFAARNGHLEACRAIMGKTVDKNPKANDGLTPKDVARNNGHLVIVKLFTKFAEHLEILKQLLET